MVREYDDYADWLLAQRGTGLKPPFPKLLLDTSVYIDALQGRLPDYTEIALRTVEWTPKLRQGNKTHFSANGELCHGSESTEVHAGI